MATLQDYLGITALRDAWPKWKANVIAVNNQVIDHVAGSADKHSAQDITYTGDFTGKTDVKAALDQAKTEIDTIVVNASIDPEVAFARDSAVKIKVFGSLDARLEDDEQDFESYKADTANYLTLKVDKVAGKGLSTNDYDVTEKAEVAKVKDKMDKTTTGISVAQINKNLGKIDQTYLTTELLEQIAGTTAISATTSPLSVTSVKLADKAITPKKTNFFKLSTNLVNHLTLFYLKSINAYTGLLVDNATNATTDFIPILPSTVYTSYHLARKAFYNADGAFISSDIIDGTWTSPANAYYMRYVSSTPYFGVSAQLNLGNTLLAFEKYYVYIPYNTLGEINVTAKQIADQNVEPEKTSFFDYSTNLFNKNMVTPGKVISSGVGILSDNEVYNVSDLVRIKPNTVYKTKYVLRLTYYDIDKAYTNYDNPVDDVSFTTPTKAVYVRFSVGRVRLDTAQVNEGITLLPYEIGGGYVKKGHIRASDVILSDFNSKELLSIDYTAKTMRKSGGDFPVIDTNINNVFNKNSVLPNNATTISSAKSVDIYALYDALMVLYPSYITKTLLGNELSPSALPIYRYDFKPVRPSATLTTKQVKYLITSGTHPERTGLWTLYNTMENICNHWQDDELLEALRFNIHFIVIPVMSPWAYDNGSRVNYNGVDMARNFPAGWVQGTFGSATYGGTAPLSEVEAQLINQIMLDNTDLLGVIDVHNFDVPLDNYQFLWGACANLLTRNIVQSHIQKIDRKWKKDYAFVNQSTSVFIGNAEGYSPGGSLGTQANAYGIRGALTYEVDHKVYADETSVYNDSITLTMAYEAFVNFLLLFSNELLKR